MSNAAPKTKITYREECDLKEVFLRHWDYVAYAYSYPLPMAMLTRDNVTAIEAMRQAHMIDDSFALDAMWRRAIDEVAAGRSIATLTDAEKCLAVEAWVRLRDWR